MVTLYDKPHILYYDIGRELKASVLLHTECTEGY